MKVVSTALFSCDGHVLQVIVSTVEDVEVDLLLDTWQLAAVGVLPESPRSFVAHAVNVIVGNPVRIKVEHRVVHVLLTETVVGVEDGAHAVVLLHACQPFKNALSEVFGADALRVNLDVEHRRQVAGLQLYIADEMLGLLFGSIFASILNGLVNSGAFY